MKNNIKMFIHCSKCLSEVLEIEGASPKNYARIGVGYTLTGIQLWCNRHDESIVNITLPPSLLKSAMMSNNSCECDSCKQKFPSIPVNVEEVA